MTETDLLEALGETADGAFALDRDGRILHWNRAAERITGLPAEQAVILLGTSLATGTMAFGCSQQSSSRASLSGDNLRQQSREREIVSPLRSRTPKNDGRTEQTDECPRYVPLVGPNTFDDP